MRVFKTSMAGLLIIEPVVHEDDRGQFYESFNADRFAAATGSRPCFVQDNHSISRRRVLRGLHYQLPPYAQEKLVRVVVGTVFDVAVDLRRESPSFGEWHGTFLSAQNKLQAWIPAGFAHGFCVVSETAELIYKCTASYVPESERCIAWNDPMVRIKWPIEGAPVLSDRDRCGVRLEDAEVF